MIYTSAPIRLNKSVDGQTPFVHIKYSDDGGLTFTPYNGETPGKYMGLCADYSEPDPTDVSKYKWSKIKGEDGAPGEPGEDGTSVTILGSYDSEDELNAAHPTGATGDSYIVNGDLYVWDGAAWKNAGTIQGPSGEDGVGVSSITTEFYLSTSKRTPTGGSWVTTMPTWTTGKYLWTRSKIVYTDSTTAYTSPVCDSSWEAVNDLDTKLNMTEVFNRLTNNGAVQGIFMKDGQLYINAEYIQALEKLFAKDITMTGKFLYTSQAYLPPTVSNAIDMLRKLYFPEKYPDLPDVDLNGDGVVDADDCILAYRVADGTVPIHDCAGARKSDVTVCIDLSNAEKTFCISGTNMWGEFIETYIGANANRSTFATRERLDRLFSYDSRNSDTRRILFRDLSLSSGDNIVEYLNPPFDPDVVYSTYDTLEGRGVKKKYDSATGCILWRTNDDSTWHTYAALMGAAPATEDSTYPGCYYRTVNGVKEWINPPMALGVEYRTTERYGDKVVYKKLITFTNSSALSGTASMYIPHGISNLDLLLSADIMTYGYFLPYVSADTSLVASAWNETNVVIYNGNSSWSSGRTWYVEMRYTKSS